jgi:phosphoglycolate phosphatase
MSDPLTILFDLDGTLSDSAVGIFRSIRYAMQQMGRPLPEDLDLAWCIGPPLMTSLKYLLEKAALGADQAGEVLTHYRQRYDRLGKLENRVYPQIPEVLTRLRVMGMRLFVATSKAVVFARDIIRYLDLEPFFEKVYGSEMNGLRTDKGELIAYVMDAEHLAPGRTWMVGDRKYDVIGAQANGIPCVGVTYGYGSAQELLSAGAHVLADNPLELLEIFGSSRGLNAKHPIPAASPSRR